MNSLGVAPKKRKVQSSMDRMKAAGRTNRGDNVAESLKSDPEKMKKLDDKFLIAKPVRDVVDNLQNENNANIIASNMENSLKGYIPPKGGRTHRYFEGKKSQKVKTETEVETEDIEATDSGKNEEGDEKYIVKTKGNTAYFPGAKHADTDTEKKSSDLSYNKEEIISAPKEETYKQKVARIGDEYIDKLDNKKKENQENLSQENSGDEDVKDLETPKEENTKRVRTKRKPIKESVQDLQNKNIGDLLGKNMKKMRSMPMQAPLADRFKKIDMDIISKMNRGEDVSSLMQDLNDVAQDINSSEEDGKEELQKEYNHLQKEIKNYNEANKVKKSPPQKEKSKETKVETKAGEVIKENTETAKTTNVNEENKGKKVEPATVDTTAEAVAKPELSEDVSVDKEGLKDKTEDKAEEKKPETQPKPKTTVEELVAEPTMAEAEVMKDFTQSVSNPTSGPTSQPKPVVEKRVVSPVTATQENVAVQQEVKTEKEEVKEVLSNIDEIIKKRAEEILASHGVKEKKSENGEGGKEKKKGFWWRLWNGTREGLKKRDDRLNSPELKKKYEELNASLEKDIGKVGNKALTVIGDAVFGNFLKGIKDGIISNKNWSGAIGEAVGSIVTRYLNSVYNVGEVVVHLVKALGKKTILGARSLVGK